MKECSLPSLPYRFGCQEFSERIISLEEVSVIHKLFLEHIMSHCIFKSVFESILLNPCCLLDYVPKCLLVGKFGH